MNRAISPQRRRERKDNAEVLPSLRRLRAFCVSAVKFLFASFQLILLCSTLTAEQTATSKAIVSEDGALLSLGNRVLLNNTLDGFMSVKQIKPAPDGKRFAVIACGYECNDNIGFLFNADGTGKRKFTAMWDFILQDKVEWSADGRRLYYFRINSSAAEAPAKAPAQGWVGIDAATERKTMAASSPGNPGRRLKTEASYATFYASSGDRTLNLREAPNTQAKIIRKLEGNVQGIRFTGQTRKAGRSVWVKIKYDDAVGWVNQNYLYELSSSSKQQ